MSLDLVLGETYDFKFTTRAFATGIPTTLAGTPGLQIYANNSATPLGYAPVLSVDVNSVNGLNNVRVVATSGNGFASGSSYAIVISAGTVDGVSVVGEVIKEFTVERAPVNWNKVRNATSTLVLTNTTIGTCTANTDMRGTNNALLAASAPANWSNFAITAGGAITVGTNNDKAGYTASSVTDKTGYSIAGTKTTLDALNDITAAAVWAVATRSLTDKAGFTISGTKTTLDALQDISAADVKTQADQSLVDIDLDHLTNNGTTVPAWAAGSYIDQLADDGTAVYDRTQHSLQAIRARGDVAWITGGGGGITDILNVIALLPNDIDLASTATYRLGLMLTNALDDLPTAAEITPGTISIDRKAIGGTTWTNVVLDAACSESAGMVYFDEVFDAASGYAEGDSIRVTFKSQLITVAANDHVISDATGRSFYTNIRQTMRGTDGAALATTALSNATWTDARAGYLDNINGHTPQTGDSFARIGATGSGLTSLAQASVATEGRLAELDAANIPADIDAISAAVLTNGVVISAATALQIADALLNRDMSVVADSNSRSPLNALRLLRNFWNVANGVLTVRKENDTDVAWTANVTGQAGANPIVSSDPN